MKLKVNQGIILIFLCESFKKKRRKPQEKQRNKKQFIVYVFFAPEKRKISKNYSFFLNTRILCMNFLQTIFLQNGFSSIKICLQNIHFRALMCVIVSISRISVVQMTHFAGECFSATYFKQEADHNKKRWKTGEKGVLKNFANFAGKQQCWSLFLTKLQAFSARQLY